MSDLETLIREAMTKGGVQALNLFRNADGVFQANIGYRDRGPAKIFRNSDPVKALASAIKPQKSPARDMFEDLLGE